MYFVEFYILGLLLVFLGLYMNLYNFSLIVVWDFFNSEYLLIIFETYFDWMGVLFSGVVLIVGSLIILYSYWYVDMYLDRFYYMMNLFILSMLLLIYSPNILCMLLGWDGLGVISFILIWFYYGSLDSVNNSLVTMLFNRLGDAFLLVGIGFYSLIGDLWGFSMMDVGFTISFFFIFGLCTKSAQFPFSSWLPKAMAAPTPVSALVHSSTLVTSGFYILVRYYDSFLGFNYLLEVLGLLTMFLGGFSACLSYDLKKIIAYSTLSQMGFMSYMLSLGFRDYAYMHMLLHAIFKSMMFMCAGVIIHETGFQDIRMCSGIYMVLPHLIIMFMGGVMSLCGFPFLCGFYSKDILLECIYSLEYSFIKLFYSSLCVLITPLYGFRLLYYMVFKYVDFIIFFNVPSNGLINSIIFLFYGCIFMGLLSFLILIDLGSSYLIFNFIINFLVFMYLFLGLVISLYYVFFNFWSGFFLFFCNFLFIDCFYYLGKIFSYMLSSLFIMYDKVWFEIGLGIKIYDYLIKLYKYIYLISFDIIFIIFLLILVFFLY